MAEGDKQPEAPKEHPAMGQIVGYLKDYPFLLITIAGLLILSGILIFDIEKLKEFKWLIYAVVLVPLGIQFLMEFKKMQPALPAAAPPPIPGQPAAPAMHDAPIQAAPPPSKKAWVSIGIGMVLFGVAAATPEAELRDSDFALGFLVAALLALGLAIAAMSDVNRQHTVGKGTAITSIVLSIILALAALGWMSEEGGVPAVPPAVNNSLPPLPAPETVLAPPASLQVPAMPAQPGLSDMEGRYQLLAHRIDGEPGAVGGTLAINRQEPDRYGWQAQLMAQNFGGMRTFNYAGQFIHRGKRWFLRVTGSNDPEWEDMGEVPMDVTLDGQNAAFAYLYDGEHVQSSWTRSH